MSAIGGKADITRTCADVFDPKRTLFLRSSDSLPEREPFSGAGLNSYYALFAP